MNKEYPFIVVPLDEIEVKKAHADGLSPTFCKSYDIAKECCDRLNKNSGVKWKIKKTENEKCEWQILEEIGKLKNLANG